MSEYRILIIQRDIDGTWEEVVTDHPDIRVISVCEWCDRDPAYELTEGRSLKRATPEQIDAMLDGKRIGHFGDMPGIENAVADALGVPRPHYLPDGPKLAISNPPKDTPND